MAAMRIWEMNSKILVFLLLTLLVLVSVPMAGQRNSHLRDTVTLDKVTVIGKSKAQKLREGNLSVNAVDIRSFVNSINNLNTVIDRTAGVKVREEGGVGSDFDLSINGMAGNSVRYFLDGVPLDTKGSSVSLANLPVSLIDHVEIYKGVVPTWLSSDALGGAVNIVTNRKHANYLDVSYGIGSFHTHKADLNGQVAVGNGFVVRPTLGVNYSKNDYMMKEVEVWDEDSRKFVSTNRRRFHDDYFSLIAQVEAGVTGKSWADAFSVAASYARMDKDVQTGSLQSKVVGMAGRESDAWSISAQYQKHQFLTRNLNANISLSHTWDHSLTVDTAYRKYDWNGDYIASSSNEITSRGRSIRHYKRPLTIARADFGYLLAEGHLLNLTYSLNRTGNDRYDEVDRDFVPSNDVLAKHILGLSYNQTFLGGRMSNTLFLKDYLNHLTIEQTDIQSVTGSKDMQGASTSNHLGYGLGTKFQIIEPIAVKASYENSVRLPLARELLGNGTTIYANVTLKPEESHNANLGLFGTLRNGEHTLSYEVNGFLRQVDNYIQATVSEKEGMMQYVNVPAVHIKGAETELRYNWKQKLSVVGNLSWQDARDRQKYKSDGKQSVTYNNHVPNRPWFFGGFDAHYTLRHLASQSDRLVLGAGYQWVHWFFLSWEGYGALDTKARIPEKNVVDVSAAYSWHGDRYNVSLECTNLLDKTIYDNYKLQKPGRAFFLKMRVLID